jgi:hypothetical protein
MVRLHSPPGRPMFQHRIEPRQQLAREGHQRHILRLPRLLPIPGI